MSFDRNWLDCEKFPYIRIDFRAIAPMHGKSVVNSTRVTKAKPVKIWIQFILYRELKGGLKIGLAWGQSEKDISEVEKVATTWNFDRWLESFFPHNKPVIYIRRRGVQYSSTVNKQRMCRNARTQQIAIQNSTIVILVYTAV